jgi:hypothetical protein
MSSETHMFLISSRVDAGVGNWTFGVTKSSAAAAICIPTNPGSARSWLDGNAHLILREWWIKWRRYIAHQWNVGQIFLILKTTETTQYINCYYEGTKSETKLQVTGSVDGINPSPFTLGMNIRESQELFRFNSHIPAPGLVIFAKLMPIYITGALKRFQEFWRRQWKYNRAFRIRLIVSRLRSIGVPKVQKDFRTPVNSNTVAITGSSTDLPVAYVDALAVNADWSLIQTADDQFYAEYAGEDYLDVGETDGGSCHRHL